MYILSTGTHGISDGIENDGQSQCVGSRPDIRELETSTTTSTERRTIDEQPADVLTLAIKGGATPPMIPLMTPIVPMMVCSPKDDVANWASAHSKDRLK